MRNAKIFRQELRAALEIVGDEKFAKIGFKRKKGGFNYVRLINDAKQVINIDGNCWPKYQPDFEFHICPSVKLSMKKITDIIAPILDQKWGISNASEIIFHEEIHCFSPKSEYCSYYANGLGDFNIQIIKIYNFVEKWVLPFLDKMTDVNDLIYFYNTNGKSILRDERWYIRVAAAHLYKNNLQEAQKVLETHLGKLGQRMQYASVFEKLGLDPKIPK